jgi:hypothetical protein
MWRDETAKSIAMSRVRSQTHSSDSAHGYRATTAGHAQTHAGRRFPRRYETRARAGPRATPPTPTRDRTSLAPLAPQSGVCALSFVSQSFS